MWLDWDWDWWGGEPQVGALRYFLGR